MSKSKKQIAAEEKAEAIERLKEIIKDGDTVYTILRSVSRSGMSRKIGLFVIVKNEPRFISYNVAKALELPMNANYDGVRIDGAGMDMGWHLVSLLGHTLGIKLNQRWS